MAIGGIGEDLAEAHLRNKGWRVLARNYRVRGGELDIVGFRSGVLAFFEVKTRTTSTFGTPAEAVDVEKIAHMRRAINEFRRAHLRNGKIPVFYPARVTLRRRVRELRIDVIEVYLSRDGKAEKINHIEGIETL